MFKKQELREVFQISIPTNYAEFSNFSSNSPIYLVTYTNIAGPGQYYPLSTSGSNYITTVDFPSGTSYFTFCGNPASGYTTPGTYYYTPLCGINTLTVTCQGAGGGGGGGFSSGATGGGGGGGAYSGSTSISVTAFTTYTVTVGAGGTGGAGGASSTNGGNGGSSWFNNSTTIYAAGGNGGGRASSATTWGTGGTAGLAVNSVGTTTVSGGAGYGYASGTVGGGGGGSAGTGTGGSATNSTGGTAGTGGGAAGANGGNGAVGGNGTSPGGGGGGGGVNKSGGTGGNGKVLLTWQATTMTIGNNPVSASNVCRNSTSVIHSFGLTACSNSTVTAVSFITNGTYVAADISNFKLWYTTTSSFTSPTQVGSTINSISASGSTITFSGLNQAIPTSTYYFWITMDVASNPTDGHTIGVNTTISSNITSVSTISGSGSASGVQTLSNPSLSSTLTPAAICSGSIFTYTPTGGSTYSWSRAVVSGISQSASSGTGNVSEVLTNTLTSPINVTYTYTTTANNCSGVSQNVVVTVNPSAAIALTSAVGTDNSQTPCINTAITPITYTVSGGATSATVTALPTGVTGVFSGATFSISGTPSVVGTFNFTVGTTGTCTQTLSIGSITVNSDAVLALTSATVTAAQNLCINNTITPVTYTISGGATSATVTALPTGVSGAFSGSTLTISGTPSVAGTFNYTVNTSGTCLQKTLTGSITVNPDAAIVLTSAGGTDNSQTPCINTAITSITYTVSGGATSATVTSLPIGVSSSFSGSTLTISGTPSVAGTFNFTVNTIGTCIQTSKTGTIIVKPDAAIGLTSAIGTDNSQAPCINTAITPITYTVSGGAASATVTALPTGVTGIFSGNILTISGTPSVSGTFNYTVNTTGTCVQTFKTGTITVNPNAAIGLTSIAGSDAQALCVNTAITTITYTVSGGATSATVTPLPTGVSGVFAGNTFTISGTPSVSGTFNYTVNTSGTCVQTSETGTITVYPVPTLSSNLNPASICSGTAFTYTATSATTGSTFSWSRAPIGGISQAGTTGTDNVNETLTNTSLSNINVTYTYTTTANGCSGYDNVVVLVRPNPQGSFTGNSRCGGDPSSLGQLTWTATAGTDTFTVEYAPGTQSNVQSGVAFNVPAGTPTIDSTYTLTKVTDSYGCIRTSGFTVGTATITLTSLAIVTNTNTPTSSTTCAGTTVSFHVTASNVHAYNWEVSTDGGSTYTLITAPGAGPVYSNYTTATLQVANATTANNGYQYRAVLTPGCGTVTASSSAAVLTVNPVPVLTGSTGGVSTVCSGIVTYTASSSVPGSTYAWTRATVPGITQPGTSGTGNVSETLTNTTTSPIAVTYNYVTTSPDNCSNTGENVIITINPDANIVLTSATGTDNQHVCLNDVITSITYTINQGATNATLSGVPTGITGNYNSGVYTISGTANQEGVFTYTINTTGPCVQTSKTGTLTVGLTLTSAIGTDNQKVCKNSPIIPITYAVGSAGATVSGLPTGVTSNYNAGVFTISGTPTIEGTYNYTVNTTGSCTTPTSKTGTLTVGLGLAANSGNPSPSVCNGQTINPIIYNIVGGTATSNWAPALPVGITVNYDGGTQTFTITGTPTVAGTYNYTVTTTGTCGTQSALTGTLTVGLGLAANSGNPSPSVCNGQTINPIIYNIVGGTATANWAPAIPTGIGYGYDPTTQTYTITGTPTVVGTYNYTVTTTGTCGTQSALTGTLTVGLGLAANSGNPSPSVCNGQTINPIIYNIVGGTATSNWTPALPAGITANYDGGTQTYTITGTPTVAGTYNYTVTTTGTCGTQSALTGTLTVGLGLAANSGNPSPSVCNGQTINPIIYNIVGGTATANWAPAIPTGIGYGYDLTTQTYTITGTPTVAGTYNYTVTTTGTCGTQSALTGTLTIGLGLAANSGNPSPSVCNGQTINPIIYNIVGGTVTANWAPAIPTGIGYGYDLTTQTYTITGTPTVAGTYNYTVTTTGTCGTQSALTGTLTVGLGLAANSGNPSPSVCNGQTINPIIYNIVGGTATANWAPAIPTGIGYGYDPTTQTYTITGTPTVVGTYNYTVTTTGTCGTQSALTGTLTVGLGLAANSGNPSPSVCNGQTINPIIYNIVGGTATANWAPAIPTGIGYGYDLTTQTYTITGTPTVAGTYNYTVTTTGTCGTQSALTGTLTVGLGLAANSGNPSPSVCNGQTINPIIYNIVGGTATANWAPAIPTGIGYGYDLTTQTYTITGTPTVAGTYNYTVTTTGTCGTQSALTGTLTVGLGLAANSGNPSPSVCNGQTINPIIYNIVGGTATSNWAPALPVGITVNYDGGTQTFTITGTPTVAGTYNYTVTTTGTCGTQSALTGTLTVGLGLAANSGNPSPSVCNGQTINPIIYNIVGGTATANWAPAIPTGIGYGYDPTTQTYTITGTPTVVGTYNYTVTTTGTCGTQSALTGTLTVGLGLAANSGNPSPSVCNGQTINPIIYNIVGGTATANWAPAIPTGIGYGYDLTTQTYTITGTPTVAGTYNYTVTTTGTCGTQSALTGTLTVGLGLAANSGNPSPSVCNGQTINPIIYNIVGGTATANWAPAIPTGIGYGYDLTTQTYTITGTPTVAGTYNYTVTTTGTCGTQSALTGTLTIGLGLAANSGNPSPSVCNGQTINPIIYNIVGGTVTANWAPAIPTGIGYGYDLTTQTYTITGTPTVAGTYNYTVTTTGTCGTQSALTGTLTVGLGLAANSGNPSPSVCNGQTINPIIYNIVGGTATANWAPAIPTGIGYGYDPTTQTYTITGTPTVVGTYNYTVTTTGTCGTQSALTGTLTVGLGLAANSGNPSPSVCNGQTINPIIYNIVGGTATANWAPAIPTGIGYGYDLTTQTYTITGTPTVAGTYNYTVTTTGTCGTQSALTGTLTIGLGLAANSGNPSPSVCNGQTINPIIYNIVGGTATANWAPAIPTGIGYGYDLTTQTYTITGTPTVAGTYNYTVTTTGTCGTQSALTGTLTVGLGLAANSGNPSPSVCNGQTINPIIYNIVGGTATANWAPAIPTGIGYGYDLTTQTYTITGTPTVAGTYNYTVTTTGTCGTQSALTGTLTVGLGSPVPGTDNQPAKCIGVAITPIVYPLISGTSAVARWSTALPPAGITAVPVGNNFVISGTPTVPGIFNYTVTTTGTVCAPASLSGRIIVNKDSIALQPGNNLNQQICSKDAILPISFSISGTASTATVSGGLNISNNNNIYTVTGTPPPAEGIYTYTVTTSGTCGAQGIASITFTIQVVAPVASFSSDVVTGAPPLNVNFTNTSTGSATAYNWDFGDGNTSTSNAINLSNYYTKEGIYTVVLKASVETSNAVCWDTATTKLLIYKLTIPNVFTPNGDGKNDVFTIKSVIVGNLKGEIFDRWGTKLYEWNSAAGGWDGRNASTGMLYPDGTYYFIITLTDINGVNTLEKGFVELIH